jgi:hypothetical protein
VQTLSFQNVLEETCFAYTPENIVKCENALMEILQWRCLVPTCSEILKLLLFISNPVEDFSDIIQMTNKFIIKVLLEYHLSSFKYSSIALASLICTLNKLAYNNFKTGILNLLQEYNIPFDLQEVAECEAAIVTYLFEEEDDQNFSFQVCESQDSMAIDQSIIDNSSYSQMMD